MAIVSRYLGHSSVNQTMVYAHPQPDNATRAIAAMKEQDETGRISV
jgi:integrase